MGWKVVEHYTERGRCMQSSRETSHAILEAVLISWTTYEPMLSNNILFVVRSADLYRVCHNHVLHWPFLVLFHVPNEYQSAYHRNRHIQPIPIG